MRWYGWTRSSSTRPRARRRALLKGELGYNDKDVVWGPWDLGRGLSFSSDMSAAWSDYSYVSGGSSLSTKIGDFSLGGRLRASLSPDGGTARGGHSVGFSRQGIPLRASETFDSDPSTGSFGRADSVGLTLGKVLDLGLGQVASFSGASAGGTGLFSQSWSAKAGLAGGILGGSLEATSSGYPASWPGLTSSYANNWYDSFGYLLPAMEGEAKKRGINGSAVLNAGRRGEVLRVSATTGEQPLASQARRDEEYSLKAQVPLSFGEGLILSPYYMRTSTRTALGTAELSDGLVDLGRGFLADVEGDSVFWSSVPFAELFWGGSATSAAFETWTAREGLSVASYKPELGLILARNYGSSLLDLILPSALSIAWTRTFSKANSSLTTTSGLALGIKIQAVNVLGQAGSHPILAGVESDEYRTSLQFQYGRALGGRETRPLPRPPESREPLW